MFSLNKKIRDYMREVIYFRHISPSSAYCSTFSSASLSKMSKRKKVDEGISVGTPTISTTPIRELQRDFPVDYSIQNNIEFKDVPLSSIYYRLFETIENHKVPLNTTLPYQQISMLSPQTPRNKRRCVLGKYFS